MSVQNFKGINFNRKDLIEAAKNFKPGIDPHIKQCLCGREFDFYLGCEKFRSQCSFCSTPNEKCIYCDKPVKELPWIVVEGNRRLHSRHTAEEHKKYYQKYVDKSKILN